MNDHFGIYRQANSDSTSEMPKEPHQAKTLPVKYSQRDVMDNGYIVVE